MVTCYYYACDLSYFDVVLCPSLSQILATNAQISFSCKPRPTQCLLAQVPKVTPSKNPRSANDRAGSMKRSGVRPSVRLTHRMTANVGSVMLTADVGG